MRKCLTMIFAVLAAFAVQAQDSLSVNERTILHFDHLAAAGNASAMRFAPSYGLLSPYASFSSASVSFDFRQESKAVVPEDGDGLRQGRFDAGTFLRLKGGSAVSGAAGYRRAVKNNVLLNETADFELLQPYVLVDTVGGNLQNESYSFRGEWMRRAGNAVYSLGGSYKAVHEYRSFDPRPRNISSDFKAGASLGVILPGGSLIGFASYRRYNQDQNVTFVSNKGANTALFHATGLGRDYWRFRSTGVFAATRYAGQGFSAGVVGSAARGSLTGGISYEWLSVTRYLSNQNDAPLTSLATGRLSAFAAWKPSGTAALEAKVNHERRDGVENVIDCAASGVYRNLLSMGMYNRDRLSASLSAVLQFARDYGFWQILPAIAYSGVSEAYLYPESNMSATSVDATCGAGFCTVRKAWIYNVQAYVGYCTFPESESSLQCMDSRILRVCADKYAFQSTDFAHLSVQAMIQRELGRQFAIFSRLYASAALRSPEVAAGVSLSIGISY